MTIMLHRIFYYFVECHYAWVLRCHFCCIEISDSGSNLSSCSTSSKILNVLGVKATISHWILEAISTIFLISSLCLVGSYRAKFTIVLSWLWGNVTLDKGRSRFKNRPKNKLTKSLFSAEIFEIVFSWAARASSRFLNLVWHSDSSEVAELSLEFLSDRSDSVDASFSFVLMQSWTDNSRSLVRTLICTQCYKTFYVCNLWVFVISKSVSPLQAFPT